MAVAVFEEFARVPASLHLYKLNSAAKHLPVSTGPIDVIGRCKSASSWLGDFPMEVWELVVPSVVKYSEA